MFYFIYIVFYSCDALMTPFFEKTLDSFGTTCRFIYGWA